MADFSVNPVGLNVKPPPQLSLADVVNTAQGLQNLQQRQQTNPLELQQVQQKTRLGEIGLSIEEQKNRERLAMQQFSSNPDNFMSDGKIDMDKINSSVPQIAPMTGSEYIGRFSNLSKAQTEASQADQNLTQDQRAMIAGRLSVLGRLGVQDKNAYISEMDLLKKENPDNKHLGRLVDAYKRTWEYIPSGPQLPGMAIAGAQQILSPSQQQAALSPQPGTLNTGSQILPMVTTPSVGGAAPTMQVGTQPLANNQIGPAGRMVDTGRVDMNNNPIFNVIDANGRVLGQQTVPQNVPESQMPGVQQGSMQRNVGQAPGNMQQGMGVARIRPGETPETLQAAQQIRTQASNAAREVPMQQYNNNQIIKLADLATTGAGANLWSNLTGGYAIVPSRDNTTNFQQLGELMARQTSSLANSSGLAGTDAARNLAGTIAGTTEWTTDAIKSTARLNRALSTGSELFNRGVEASFTKSNDPFASRDFQNKWSQTLGNQGIDAIRLYDAVKNKNEDPQGLKQFVDSIGGPNSKKYKEILGKIGQMNLLLKGQ